MFVIGGSFAKLGCFVNNQNLFSFNCGTLPGAMTADLFTESMLGHFLVYFQASPASQENNLSLCVSYSSMERNLYLRYHGENSLLFFKHCVAKTS